MIHELKTDPDQFILVRRRQKTFEIRFNDRNFQDGDVLLLKETLYSAAEMKRGEPLVYTGPTLAVCVTHVMRGSVFGLQDGWVCMSFYRPD